MGELSVTGTFPNTGPGERGLSLLEDRCSGA